MDSTCSCKDAAKWVLCVLWGSVLGFKDAFELIVSNGPYSILPPTKELIMESVEDPPSQPQEEAVESKATELQTIVKPTMTENIEQLKLENNELEYNG